MTFFNLNREFGMKLQHIVDYKEIILGLVIEWYRFTQSIQILVVMGSTLLEIERPKDIGISSGTR